MRLFTLLFLLCLSLGGFSQAPTNTVRNISVRKFLNTYMVIFDYQRGTGTNIAADSFVVQLHSLSNVCAPSNCLPANGDFFKNSTIKTVSYSDFQLNSCGLNTLRSLKFRMKSTGLGSSTKDTVIITCIDTLNFGVLVYTANGTFYKTNGYNCTSPNIEPKIWTSATATLRMDSIPSNQVSNLSISGIDSTFFTINWRNSFSDSVLVLGFTDTASSVTFTNPIDGVDYGSGASRNYAIAPSTGPGNWQVFYAGANTNPGGSQSLQIFNIPTSKINRYHIRVIAYNKDVPSSCVYGIPINNAYFTTTVPGIFTKLRPTPPLDTIKSFRLDAFDSVSVDVSFQLPECDSFLMVYSASGFPTFLPNGYYQCPNDSNNISINNFDTLNNNSFRVIFKGSGYPGQTKFLKITGLQPDQYVYLTLFIFNSNGQGFENFSTNAQYLRSYTDANYPSNCPIYQGSFSNISNISGTNFFEYTIAWDKGINTTRTLVVLSQNGHITGNPNEKREYFASDQFGVGDQLAPGEFIVYDDTSTFVTVTDIPRLGPSTPIYFKLYSFNGSKVSQTNSDSANTYYNIYCTLDSFLLPVELKSIKAYTENDSVVLHWITALEKNNRGFQVQWSPNGKIWYNEAFIQGKGNSSVEHSYRWAKSLHEFPLQFYIRYQQIDFNGKISTSPAFSIRGIAPEQPFQFTQSQELSFFATRTGKLNYQIFNQIGIPLKKESISVSKNERIFFPIHELPVGYFIIHAELESQSFTPFKFSIFR
jgi:hypothetical protein